MQFRRRLGLPVVVGTLLLAGCAPSIGGTLSGVTRGVGAGVGTAIGEGVGRAIGDRIAAGIVRRLPPVMTPDLTTFYIGYLFSVAFHSGTYSLEQTPYAPGEWTRWQVGGDEEGSAELERAFLGRTDAGDEWWRVKYLTVDKQDTAVMVLEGLFSADKSELRRLRALMPGDTAPGEVPIQEGTYGYVQPIPLTDESIAGATVGTERITVPAGTFQTRHVRYGSPSEGHLDWWLSDQVPGGLVRYTVRDPEEGSMTTVELHGHGKGARSELGVTF